MNSQLALAGSLVLLALASLPGKLALEPRPVAPALPPAERLAALAGLPRAEWRPAGSLLLTADGAYRAQEFRSPRCPGAVLVVPVSPNGEADAMLAGLAGAEGRLTYVQAGRVYERPPVLRAYLASKLGPLSQRLGLADRDADWRLIAVVVTGGCRIP